MKGRTNQIRQAALLRNRIIEIVKAAVEPLTVAQISKDAKLVEINGGPIAGDRGDFLIRRLWKEDVFSRVRIQRVDEPNSRYAYEMFDKNIPRNAARSATPKQELPSDVKLDIIRETGKLRLTFQGLVIEIGVI